MSTDSSFPKYRAIAKVICFSISVATSGYYDMFEFFVNQYCLIVDNYSGYFDFKRLVHPPSHSVMEYLKDCFATHGIPDILEFDNSPQYFPDAFHKFIKIGKCSIFRLSRVILYLMA